MSEIGMPRLSDSMEQGTILTWLKRDGEQIAEGEELVEIETDKATMAYPSPRSGLLSIIAFEGSTLSVGEPIARISATPGPLERSLAADPRAVSAQAPRNGAGDPHVALAPSPASHPPSTAASALAADVGAQAKESAVRATPVARRLARTHGIELGSLSGSGPRGRVTRRDVAAAIEQDTGATPSTSKQPPVRQTPSLIERGGVTVRTLTRLQQVIASRMAEVQATVPDFQVEAEVAMDAAMSIRAQLKDATATEVVPSINDIIVKACALALRAHPLANGAFTENGFELHESVNVGIAVAAEQALLVPTITDADIRSLGSIARETRRLSERARNGTIAPAEFAGATFTVSNLGMFGMTAIKPVVNMPQAAILGVGALRSVLARGEEGEIVDRTLLTLTLSCDHRILYGADAARFLADIKALLEAPMRLAL